MGRENLEEKLRQLEELMEDEEIQKFFSGIEIKGKENFVSILGNVKKEIHNHFHNSKVKAQLQPELSEKERKALRDFVHRIVPLELQAREHRIRSPYGITARERRKAFAQVWKVIHDKYEITDYKMLPKKNYQSALTFLRNWESALLNQFVKRKIWDINISKQYLLKKLFGVAKANGKTKEDLELYCLQKFSLTLGEALPGHIWYVYTRYATRERRFK